MNVNKWLCKHFDEHKKGYVTIGDVFNKTVSIIINNIEAVFAAVVFAFIMDSIGLVIDIIIFPVPKDEQPTLYLLLYHGLHGWATIIEFLFPKLAVVGIVIYALYMISKIKIAKCPLKED